MNTRAIESRCITANRPGPYRLIRVHVTDNRDAFRRRYQSHIPNVTNKSK